MAEMIAHFDTTVEEAERLFKWCLFNLTDEGWQWDEHEIVDRMGLRERVVGTSCAVTFHDEADYALFKLRWRGVLEYEIAPCA